MNQAEQRARIIALEKQVARHAEIGIERGERIERMEAAVLDLHDRVGKLEEPARYVANMETARIQDIEFVKMLYSTVTTQGKRVGKLEAALAVLSAALE